MATKIAKVFQKIFGSTSGANQLARFGSLAAGAPIISGQNPSDIQSLSQFTDGWFSAVLGGNSPAIEDENALDYLYSYQLAYLIQAGVSEWDATTIYFYGSIVNVGGILYVCVNDNAGAGQFNENPSSTTGFWALMVPTTGNSLLNGAFDNWQRGTSFAIPNTAGSPAFTYTADRWAGCNVMSTSGIFTVTQVAGTVKGSKFGLQSQVTVASGTPAAVGCQMIHVLDSVDSLPYYNNVASFSVNVKALGNITAVALQFIALSSDTNVGANFLGGFIGSPVVVPVNSSGFALCSIPVQAMGTTMGLSGVVGILISAASVSSGHVSDLNNGFVLEQAMMTAGLIQPFKRQFTSSFAERDALENYFEKTFEWTTTPASGGSGTPGQFLWQAVNSSASPPMQARFRKRKRATPTVALFNPNVVSASQIFDTTATTSYSASVNNISTIGFTIGSGAAPTSGNFLTTQFTADAEIY